MGVVVGYARVSSIGQSLDVQRKQLEAAGCAKIFQEKRWASKGSNRPRPAECLDWIREGDTLMITRLDRIAESVSDLPTIADKLRSKKVPFNVLDRGIDTGTSEGSLIFNMLGAFGEFENDLRRERQQDGIEHAKAKGVRFGRKRILTDDDHNEIKRLRERDSFTIAQLKHRFRVGRSTIYRALQD